MVKMNIILSEKLKTDIIRTLDFLIVICILLIGILLGIAGFIGRPLVISISKIEGIVLLVISIAAFVVKFFKKG